MSGAKHTPGPWHVVTGDGHDRRVMAANDPGPVAIAFRPSEATLVSEAQANARLIAAAPDLLALAERIDAWEGRLLMEGEWGAGLPRFTQSLYDEWMELQAQRNAAIAKARGES